MSLRDTADQLLMNSESPEMSQAKDKMHIIANRLRALLRLCSSYISSLETRLDSKSMVMLFGVTELSTFAPLLKYLFKFRFQQ